MLSSIRVFRKSQQGRNRSIRQLIFRPSLEALETRALPSSTIYGGVPGVMSPFGPSTPGDIYKIDPQTGAQTLVWQGAAGTGHGVYGGMVVESNGIILFEDSDGLYQLDPSATPPVATRFGSGSDSFLAIGPNGQIYGGVSGVLNPFAHSPGAIYQIDPQTGAQTLVWQGAADTSHGVYGGMVVKSNGIILFEDSDGLYQLDPTATPPVATSLGGGPGYLAIGPGGHIYRGVSGMSSPFSPPVPGGIYSVDPQTGAETLVWQGAAGTAHGVSGNMAVESNGTILFEDIDGLYQLDPTATPPVATRLVPNGFFSLAVAPSASALVLTAPPTVTAGTSFAFTVRAVDQYGQTAVGYTGTVHFTASNGATANYTFTPADLGTHTFPNIVLRQAGTLTVTGTDTADATITGSTAVTVVAGLADHIALVLVPSSVTAGAPFSLTATVQDQYNNTVTGYTGTVHFQLTGPVMPSANYSFTGADLGSHTFGGLVLNQPGDYTLTATYVGDPTINGSLAFTVSD
jgi:sugar lactone lactonase YvrE